jgi:hypothetical protein
MRVETSPQHHHPTVQDDVPARQRWLSMLKKLQKIAITVGYPVRRTHREETCNDAQQADTTAHANSAVAEHLCQQAALTSPIDASAAAWQCRLHLQLLTVCLCCLCSSHSAEQHCNNS